MSMGEIIEYECQLRRELEKKGFSPETAADTAADAAEKLLAMFGGQQLYVPQDKSQNIELRDIEIRKKYRELVLSLCKEYRVGFNGFYKIIRGRPRKKISIKDQIDLFNNPR